MEYVEPSLEIFQIEAENVVITSLSEGESGADQGTWE